MNQNLLTTSGDESVKRDTRGTLTSPAGRFYRRREVDEEAISLVTRTNPWLLLFTNHQWKPSAHSRLHVKDRSLRTERTTVEH